MAKVPNLKRIAVEDFPADQQSLISKLAFPINSFFEEVRAGFNKSINFDNLAQEVIILSFITNDKSQPIATLKFKTTVGKVSGIIPISLKILDNSQGALITQAPFINFTQSETIITINSIAGLSANTKYQINLLVI